MMNIWFFRSKGAGYYAMVTECKPNNVDNIMQDVKLADISG
jgi:hypothetical protein